MLMLPQSADQLRGSGRNGKHDKHSHGTWQPSATGVNQVLVLTVLYTSEQRFNASMIGPEACQAIP